MRDIIGSKLYWLCPTVFTIAFFASLYAPSVEPESTQLFLGCALLFAAIASVSILFPILRRREANRASLASICFKRSQFSGVHIPYSNVVHTIFKIMTPVMGIAAWVLTLAATDFETRIKIGIGATLYTALVLVYAWKGLSRRLGILVAPEGILLLGLIEAYFVPWEALAGAATFMAKEQYGSSKAIGFTITRHELVSMSGSSKQKLVENAARQGFALFAYSANILAPPEWIEKLVNHYVSRPQDRALLATDRALYFTSSASRVSAK